MIIYSLAKTRHDESVKWIAEWTGYKLGQIYRKIALKMGRGNDTGMKMTVQNMEIRTF